MIGSCPGSLPSEWTHNFIKFYLKYMSACAGRNLIPSLKTIDNSDRILSEKPNLEILPELESITGKFCMVSDR